MFPPTPWCDPAQNASVITLPSAIGHVEDMVIQLQASLVDANAVLAPLRGIEGSPG